MVWKEVVMKVACGKKNVFRHRPVIKEEDGVETKRAMTFLESGFACHRKIEEPLLGMQRKDMVEVGVKVE